MDVNQDLKTQRFHKALSWTLSLALYSRSQLRHDQSVDILI